MTLSAELNLFGVLQFDSVDRYMGLESFKTDGPRSSKTRASNNSSNNAIHVAQGVDLSALDIPRRLKKHEVEYYVYIPPNEDQDGTVLCHCIKCNKVASSYEAIIKSDYLKYSDSNWASQYKPLAMQHAPDKPSPDVDIPDSDTEDDDLSSSDDSGGLESFMS